MELLRADLLTAARGHSEGLASIDPSVASDRDGDDRESEPPSIRSIKAQLQSARQTIQDLHSQVVQKAMGKIIFFFIFIYYGVVDMT